MAIIVECRSDEKSILDAEARRSVARSGDTPSCGAAASPLGDNCDSPPGRIASVSKQQGSGRSRRLWRSDQLRDAREVGLPCRSFQAIVAVWGLVFPSLRGAPRSKHGPRKRQHGWPRIGERTRGRRTTASLLHLGVYIVLWRSPGA